MTLCVIVGDGPVAEYLATRLNEISPNRRVFGLRGTRAWLSKVVPEAEFISRRDIGSFLPLLQKLGVTKILFAGDVTALGRATDGESIYRAMGNVGSLWEPHALLETIKAAINSMGIDILGPIDVFPELTVEPETLIGRCGDHVPRYDFCSAVEHVGNLYWKEQWQSHIVDDGAVIMSESLETRTDALINEFGQSTIRARSKYPVLCKFPIKPFEGMVTPTIGIHTLHLCSASGIKGVIIEAGKTILMQREEVKSFAERESICLHALSKKQVLRDKS